MKKIESLTPEQSARFPEFVAKWTAIGLNTDRANRSRAEEMCRKAYEVAGLQPPKVILWAESPMGLLLTAKLVKEIAKRGYEPYSAEGGTADVWDSVGDSVWDSVWASVRASVWASVRASVGDSVWDSVGASVWASVWDSVWASVRDSVWDSVWASVRASVGDSVGDSVWDSVWASVRASVGDSVWDSVGASGLRDEWAECYSWGQHDASWLGFYDFFCEVLGLEVETRKLHPLTELSKETGWHLFYKDVAILSEKPTELRRNARGQLHDFNQAAIKWNDGYELHRFNGVRVTKELAEKSEFSKADILSEQNADIRREIVRKIGIEKTVEILQPKVIDEESGYQLLAIDLGDNRVRPFLRMQNPSLDLVHIEGVSPGIETVKAALCYRNGLKKYESPAQLS